MSLVHSESEVKLDVSDQEQSNKKQEPQSPVKKRFSILGDLDELNRNLQKLEQDEQKSRKISYSEDVLRKTLELTTEIDPAGDEVLKLNLQDRQDSVQAAANFGQPQRKVQVQTIANAVPIKKQFSQRYEQPPVETKVKRQPKQQSCQTVVIKNPRMYKVTRTINLMNEPQIRLAQDFSHQLYRNSTIGTSDKENTEYNLFSKAIETQRLKDKESFGTYFKWHN